MASSLPPSLREQNQSPWALVLVALALLVVFTVDIFTALGFAAGMLYVPAVMGTLWLRSVPVTLATGVLASLLSIVGWLLSPEALQPLPPYYVLANRGVALLAIIITSTLVILRLKVFKALESSNRTLESLQQRFEEQHRLLTAASSVGAMGGWRLEVASQRVYWSDEVARIHGLAADAPRPTLDRALEFYHPDDRDRVARTVAEAIRNARNFEFDARLQPKGGQMVWIRVAGQPVYDVYGQVTALEGALLDITARKRVDDAHRISLLRFKRLAESMPLTVWTAQADGTVDYVTQAFFDYTGYAALADHPDHWLGSLHPDDRVGCMQVWQESVASGHDYQFEFRVRRHDGEYRWHRVQARLIVDHDDGEQKWYGSLVDIHDQRTARDAADHLAQQLQLTLESISDAFFTLDTRWNFTFLNSRAEQILHRSREDLLGKNVWREFAPAVGTTFETEYRRAMKTGQPVVFEQYYGPLETWFEVHAYPSANGLAVYFQDITERRRNEAQLRLLETAVAHLNDVVLITEAEPIDDPGPRIVYVNDAFERRTGYSRQEVLGKTPRMLQGPETSRTELARIRNALARWQPVRTELCNYTRSGEPYWVEIEIVPLSNEKGWFTHWVAVERDITDRRQWQQRLQQFQRLEAVGQLTGGVAHDFNNLLTVMLGNAEVLAEELSEDNPELAGHARLVVQAGLHGAELTKRLLTFARRQPLEPMPLDINRVVRELEELLRRTLDDQIELQCHLGNDIWAAMADPTLLEDAMLNLVLNARDAMPEGGRLTIETANVHLGADYARKNDIQAGDYVQIAVSDTGTGIPLEHQKMLFEPFFTTKPRGKGTGLGLPMVYGFMKQSDGHVAVYSEPGQGTTMRLYLPRTGEPARERAAAALQVPESREGETILMVEDEPLVREFAESALQSLGYNVLVAANGVQALQVLNSEEKIDLLFTDVVMPGGIGGPELAQRALSLRPGLKVLYTSGYTENAIVHHGRLDPGVLLLGKPYRRAELANKIRLALDTSPDPRTSAS